VSWADVIDSVAAALAERPLSRRTEPLSPGGGRMPHSPSLLAALTAAEPLKLLRRHQHHLAEGRPAEGAKTGSEMLDAPPELLAGGIIDIAGQAAATHTARGRRDEAAGGSASHATLTAVVAISALSTIHLGWLPNDAALAAVRGRLGWFTNPNWEEALDALADRTGELLGLLSAARDSRQHAWPQVTPDDRMLAEAVAAAVIGGAASASGMLPDQWRFPFQVFCKLGISAAWDAVSTIEQWLGIEFRPARGVERQASLGEFILTEARDLHLGCACKDDIDPHQIGFTPRGSCRQADHDIRRWRPGEGRPGSQAGSRFAETLWGWLRRWLGGPGGGGAIDASGRPLLRSHDVAGSVVARKWLATDHGLGGPVLRYDRILPEFCLGCLRRPQIRSIGGAAGHIQIKRVCCANQQLVYQSEFSVRRGKRLLKPKLGLIVDSADGTSGYMPTDPLGPLWVCDISGRYSRSGNYCPNPGCGQPRPGHHARFKHGWVLLPLSEAWDDLRDTARPEDALVGAGNEHRLSEPDLRLLREELIRLQPANRSRLRTEQEIWAVAQSWSRDDFVRFTRSAGDTGVQLLLQCGQIAMASGQGPAPDEEARKDGDDPNGDDDERGLL
jgi:hypothetical protein